jgi:hypothetical protein
MNPGESSTKNIRERERCKVQYKDSTFSGKRVELDGNYFNHCKFNDCIIVLERGDTDITGSSFENCKLLLKGNAYIIGKIIKLFTGKSLLKVLDFDEPLFEKTSIE